MTVVESSFVALPLNQLIGHAQRHLEDLGYSTRARRHCACVWRALASIVVHSRTSLRLTRQAGRDPLAGLPTGTARLSTYGPYASMISAGAKVVPN